MSWEVEIANLEAKVDRLQAELKALQNRKPFDGTAFGEQIVEAVKSYVDKRIGELDTARRQQRLAFEEELSDVRRRLDDHIAAVERKAVKPKVQIPIRSTNGAGKVTQ